jgi:hypothetical protein
MPDPVTIVSGISAVKTTFDALRAAIGLVKDAKDLLPKTDTTAVITAALVAAELSSRIAEAEVAKALGYELCRTHFPPVVMLEVGYHTANADKVSETGKPVFDEPGGFDFLTPRFSLKNPPVDRRPAFSPSKKPSPRAGAMTASPRYETTHGPLGGPARLGARDSIL